jgi:hypothetical protein
MTKLVIAAATAVLLGSTAVSLADDSGRYTPVEALAAPAQQQVQLNSVRNVRAQINAERQAVRPINATENAWFAQTTPSPLAN